ncbi:MAG: GntR family transcriptional regulator [Fibrella sp.]|nr:GntR family transcriptional regulator [Armatimonadota bacterium]
MTGRKLPGERELALRLGVSRQQVRVLLDILESEEVVHRRQGSGTYAAEVKNADIQHVALVLDARLKLGNDPFFSLIMERLQLGLQAGGTHCVVERTDGTMRPRFLSDGIITLGTAGLESLAHLRPEDPPAVSLLAEEQYPHSFRGVVSLLLAEDQGAGYAAAVRAIEEGAKHLLFVGRHHLPASRARWEGVRAAVELSENGSIIAEMQDSAMNYGAGLAVARVIAERFATVADGSVVLIAANDWLAVGLRAGLSAAASPLNLKTIYSFDGLTMASDPALNIRSLRIPLATFAEDALMELKRLRRGGKGRVIRYALEWADGASLPALMPPAFR